ncbi:uncharacterized protein BP5553_10008 [Venustampulla echinocandica]|uniref:Uncharacterized protein n=1 Tax=Venustampulla echinocandica TaxID=2656787 RepID=A0A370TA20_9HELO|nr:uncharacterized protein BP5553_10008 [Venustampulla echinocandica]RDL30663.1 hypothetical protein BP5553_10008 [Venustampulla echinocandica]
MSNLAGDVNGLIGVAEPIKFTFIVRRDEGEGIWRRQFKPKMEADKEEHPMKRWIKDSPTANTLLRGNIFKAYEGPTLPEPGFIVSRTATWQDQLQMQVRHVYAADLENQFAKCTEEECNRLGIKDVFIIRVGSLGIERSKYTSKTLPKLVLDNMRQVENDDALKFISHKYLHDLGMTADKSRKSGDKRFTNRCQNISLHEAMWNKFEAEKYTNDDYANLYTTLHSVVRCPHDDTINISDINPIVKILMIDTLLLAQVICLTSAQAIRFTFHTLVPEFTFLILDDGAKRRADVTMAICGAFKYRVVFENGDIKQLGTYAASADNKEF